MSPMYSMPAIIPTMETPKIKKVGDVPESAEKKKNVIKLHCACMFWNATTKIITVITIDPDRKNVRKFLMFVLIKLYTQLIISLLNKSIKQPFKAN